jgi:hypothetical protein
LIGGRLRRSLLVGVGVAAVSLALASGALANTTITNNPAWNGTSATSGFGYTVNYCCTQTYGQTVTVPASDPNLDSFTFYVDLPTTLIFRGEVYAWDPTTGVPANNTSGNATGPALYESGQTHTTAYDPNGRIFEPITFNTGGIPLTAGKQYVLFFTISQDYAANAPTAGMTGFAGVTTTDTIPGGDWVYTTCTTFDAAGNCSTGGDPTQWTNPLNPWSNQVAFGVYDLAFTATFSPPLPTSKAQCMNGGWKTYGFTNQGQCVSFVNTGKNPPSGP